MIIIKRRTILLLLFVAIFLVSTLLMYNEQRSRFKIGDRYIRLNTQVKLDPKKQYSLQLWDYDWSIVLGEQKYQRFMEGLISEFQSLYPNIKVQLTLIDPTNDQKILEDSLKRNEAPDVYCSANNIPLFDYQYQIPVGPYLTEEELKIFHPELIRNVSLEGIVGCFPRWVMLNYWIGNRRLLEKANVSIEKIQTIGWDWEDLLKIDNLLDSENYLLSGNISSRGLLSYILNTGNEIVEDQVEILVERLEQLKTIKMSKNYDSNMLGDFLMGKTVVLAGIRPVLYSFIRQEVANRNQKWIPVLLPAPTIINNRNLQLVENGVVCVYRNRRTKGDEHLLAAVKLGHFVSTYKNNDYLKQLSFIPAVQMSGKESRADMDLINLSQFLNHSTLIQLEPIAHQDSISKVIKEYMRGKITKEELKIVILNL